MKLGKADKARLRAFRHREHEEAALLDEEARKAAAMRQPRPPKAPRGRRGPQSQPEGGQPCA